MKAEIKVPPLGESVTEATVSNILKPSGSVVKRDEEILELETDKVNQVLYAPQEGKLTWLISKEATVRMGDVIGFVEPGVAAPPSAAPVPVVQPTVSKESVVATPALEKTRLQKEEFLQDLKAPSSPALQPPAEKAVPSHRKKMSSLRKVIATRLVEAKNHTAMLTTFNEIDLSQVIAIRAQEKESFAKAHGVKLGFMSFFVKAAVAALKANPQVNAMIDGDDIVTYTTYDIGVAVSTERGLMVPVIRGCDQLNFAQVESALEGYAKKAREGKLAIEDLKGGSFTITNGGVFGSLLSTPILNPPQSAILGMHAIVKRPVVVNDQIVIRPMMYVALSYDHRIIDGKEAVLFLVHLKQSLEDPSRLLLDL